MTHYYLLKLLRYLDCFFIDDCGSFLQLPDDKLSMHPSSFEISYTLCTILSTRRRGTGCIAGTPIIKQIFKFSWNSACTHQLMERKSNYYIAYLLILDLITQFFPLNLRCFFKKTIKIFKIFLLFSMN